MHLYKKNSSISKPFVLTITVFVAIILFFTLAVNNMEKDVDSNEIKTLISAIDNAVISCYATTGVYPENISQIEDKYGVIIEHDRFIVNYEIITSNTRPNVSIYVKGDN